MAIAWACSSHGCVGDDGDSEGSEGAATTDEGSEGDVTTGAAPACDPQPASPALYSSCTGTGSCSGDLVCALPTGADPAVDPAYCTTYCTLGVECPTVGSCTAEPRCITQIGGGTGVCALDCSEGKLCPETMDCLEDMDSGGLRYLCF